MTKIEAIAILEKGYFLWCGKYTYCRDYMMDWNDRTETYVFLTSDGAINHIEDSCKGDWNSVWCAI